MAAPLASHGKTLYVALKPKQVVCFQNISLEFFFYLFCLSSWFPLEGAGIATERFSETGMAESERWLLLPFAGRCNRVCRSCFSVRAGLFGQGYAYPSHPFQALWRHYKMVLFRQTVQVFQQLRQRPCSFVWAVRWSLADYVDTALRFHSRHRVTWRDYSVTLLSLVHRFSLIHSAC